MPGKVYTYTDMFSADIEKNLKKVLGVTQKIEESIKSVQKVASTGEGLKKITEDSKKHIKVMEGFNKAQKERLATQKKINDQVKKTTRENEKNLRQLRKIGDSLNVRKQTEKELLRLKKQEASQQARANAEIQRWSKLEETSIVNINRKVRALTKLRGNLDLTSKEYREVTADLNRLIAVQKREQEAIGRNQLHVGNYGRALNNTGKAVGRFVERIGAMALAYVGFQTVRESIELFKVQEQAVKDNEAVFGAYSKTIQAFAADVQKVTTVGDEQTIALTTQARNFGLAVEDVQQATIGAIGLAEKFKKAGLSQETALKGIALAYAGNFSQLERYIPALRSAKDEAEKMAILQDEMANGFNLAKEAAKTQTGQLQQMKNEMGDVKEEIGEGLIPVLLKISSIIRDSIKGWKLFFNLFKKQINPETAEYIENLKEELKLEDSRTKRIKIGTEKQRLENELLKERNILRDHKTFLGIDDDFTKIHKERVEILKEEILELKKLRENEQFFKVAVEETAGALEDEADGAGKAADSSIKSLEVLSRKAEEGFGVKQLSLFESIIGVGKDGKIISEPEKLEAEIIKTAVPFFTRIRRRIRFAFATKEEGSFFSRLLGVDNSQIQKIKQQISRAFSQAMSLINQQIQNQRAANDELISLTDQRIEKLQEEYDSEVERVNNLKELEKGRSVEKLQLLEKQLAREQEMKDKALLEDVAIKRKQKAFDIINAQINTFTAISNALTLQPTWVGIVMAAIMGGLGLAQVANIQNAKYADGTNYLLRGNSPRGTDTIPIFANEGERIVPTEDNSGIPRTFPNSELSTAVQYYLDGKSNTPILNLYDENGKYFKEIAENTRGNGIEYEEGKVKSRKIGNTTKYYHHN